MKYLSIPLGFILLSGILHAQKAGDDATQIVREARHSLADESYDISGVLAKGRKKVPFMMSMEKKLSMIRFRFKDPVQIISLVLKDNRYELTEQVAGQPAKPLAQNRYGAAVRGTDVTYEDISQRFLYWPKPKILGSEKLIKRQRDAWIVRLDNPRRNFGPYAVVKAWIDKETKSLLQVEGFDWQGRKVKRFSVLRGQREEGVWVLKSMRVETIDPEGNRKADTHMSLDKPVRRK